MHREKKRVTKQARECKNIYNTRRKSADTRNWRVQDQAVKPNAEKLINIKSEKFVTYRD
jgi:hypothetical protein